MRDSSTCVDGTFGSAGRGPEVRRRTTAAPVRAAEYALGATNLLIDHAARTLLRPGGWLHLGGGITADDGLDTFKRSMATTTTATLLCQTVVDRPRYAELCQRAVVGDTEYFPAYQAAL